MSSQGLLHDAELLFTAKSGCKGHVHSRGEVTNFHPSRVTEAGLIAQDEHALHALTSNSDSAQSICRHKRVIGISDRPFGLLAPHFMLSRLVIDALKSVPKVRHVIYETLAVPLLSKPISECQSVHVPCLTGTTSQV